MAPGDLDVAEDTFTLVTSLPPCLSLTSFHTLVSFLSPSHVLLVQSAFLFPRLPSALSASTPNQVALLLLFPAVTVHSFHSSEVGVYAYLVVSKREGCRWFGSKAVKGPSETLRAESEL